MNLGAFSISLTVKDLAASTAFYEKLGFAAFGGDPTQGGRFSRTGTVPSRVTIVSGADDSTEGPASIVLEDPDGNPILIDQHR
ncbi:hypothetical protein [Rhodoglobus aureus]|uniref:VOC domain-containing protein n=1 Tax=Rhodoglobus aureus TaxID=191497 RepID=A0ABP4G7K9_9MICO